MQATLALILGCAIALTGARFLASSDEDCNDRGQGQPEPMPYVYNNDPQNYYNVPQPENLYPGNGYEQPSYQYYPSVGVPSPEPYYGYGNYRRNTRYGGGDGDDSSESGRDGSRKGRQYGGYRMNSRYGEGDREDSSEGGSDRSRNRRRYNKGGYFNVEHTSYGKQRDVPYYPFLKDVPFAQGVQGQESNRETAGGQRKGQGDNNSQKGQNSNGD